MAKKTEEADTGKCYILEFVKTNTGQLLKSLSLQGEGMGGGIRGGYGLISSGCEIWSVRVSSVLKG